MDLLKQTIPAALCNKLDPFTETEIQTQFIYLEQHFSSAYAKFKSTPPGILFLNPFNNKLVEDLNSKLAKLFDLNIILISHWLASDGKVSEAFRVNATFMECKAKVDEIAQCLSLKKVAPPSGGTIDDILRNGQQRYESDVRASQKQLSSPTTSLQSMFPCVSTKLNSIPRSLDSSSPSSPASSSSSGAMLPPPPPPPPKPTLAKLKLEYIDLRKIIEFYHNLVQLNDRRTVTISEIQCKFKRIKRIYQWILEESACAKKKGRMCGVDKGEVRADYEGVEKLVRETIEQLEKWNLEERMEKCRNKLDVAINDERAIYKIDARESKNILSQAKILKNSQIWNPLI